MLKRADCFEIDQMNRKKYTSGHFAHRFYFSSPRRGFEKDNTTRKILYVLYVKPSNKVNVLDTPTGLTALKMFSVHQPLLDGVVDYLPEPFEVTNFALDAEK